MDSITATATATATASPARALVPAAKLLAISASLFLSGINFAAAHITRPVLSAPDAPSASPSSVAAIYYRGARAAVSFSLVSGLSSALVAILTYDRAERSPWIVACICFFAALPFARVVARETAGVLRKPADASDKARLMDDDSVNDGAEISRQLRRWKRMGLFRSAFAMVGGLVSLFAVVWRS